MPFFLIFILLPVAEIAVFLQVADEIGFLGALGLLILAGFAGGALLRYQGFQTILSMRQSMRGRRAQAAGLFDGFFMMLAGFLLILPGFLSDVLALSLLLPGVRRILRDALKAYVFQGASPQPGGRARGAGDVIEGEYEDLGESGEDKTLIEGGDKPGGS